MIDEIKPAPKYGWLLRGHVLNNANKHVYVSSFLSFVRSFDRWKRPGFTIETIKPGRIGGGGEKNDADSVAEEWCCYLFTRIKHSFLFFQSLAMSLVAHHLYHPRSFIVSNHRVIMPLARVLPSMVLCKLNVPPNIHDFCGSCSTKGWFQLAIRMSQRASERTNEWVHVSSFSK